MLSRELITWSSTVVSESSCRELRWYHRYSHLRDIVTSVDNGHLSTFLYLVAQGADIHIREDAPLRISARNGNLTIMKYLVERGADIHARDDASIRDAAWNGHLAIVQYLVVHGTDIHALNEALCIAAYTGYLSIVQYLVEQGANIHIRKDTPIRNAAKNGHPEVLRYLQSLK